MWTAEAIEKMREVFQDSTKVQLFSDIYDGRIYADRSLHPVEKPELNVIGVSTLTGLCDLIKFEGEKFKELIVVVQNPEVVEVVTGLHNGCYRDWVFRACITRSYFPFGKYLDAENFIIGVRSLFVQNEDSQYLLSALQQISTSAAVTTLDNGITQQVETKAGVVLKGNEKTKPILKLAPYRTFAEIEQPESDFLFRITSNMQAALFEADGGAWRNVAMLRIRDYLQAEIGELACIASIVA